MTSTEDANEAVRLEIARILDAIHEEREASKGSSYRALLQNGKQRFRLRTLLGIGGQFMQQLSGINLITYYAPTIFQNSVGMSHELSLLLAGFNGVAYFFSSLIPIWIIDRLGRRKLMLFAAAGQGALMAILAGTVRNGSAPAGIVASVMLFAFNFFFAVGLLAIPWLCEYVPIMRPWLFLIMGTSTCRVCAARHSPTCRCSRFGLQLDFYFSRS